MMPRKLRSGREGPPHGQAQGAVVFVHGYGADGADLLGLAGPLGAHLPGVAFHAPDAPESCAGNPFGRQWFPIPWLDGSAESAAEAGLRASATDLDAFLDGVLEAEGIGPERLALVGFSQGSMMALHVAPRRPAPLAGVVAFSGRLLHPERLAVEAKVRPPVLLAHGDADPVVPFADMDRAGAALDAAGFETFRHVMRGTGHGISPDGLSVALGFLRRCLGL
jgi:phospholipase/carboxylesterase